MKAARKFAAYTLIAFKPWDGPDGIPTADSLTWKAMCVWLKSLRDCPVDDITNRTRLAFVTIAAHGLRICSASNATTSDWRFRDATIWADLREEDRPAACTFNKQNTEAAVTASHTAQEGELAMNRLLNMASASSNEKSLTMQGQTVQFLNQIFPLQCADVGASAQLNPQSSREDCYGFVGLDTFSARQVKRVNWQNQQQQEQEIPALIPQSESGLDVNGPGNARRGKGKKRRAAAASPILRVEPADAPASNTIQWSPQQQEVIDYLQSYLTALSDWRNSPSNSSSSPPEPPNMMILGGPGSGKSAVTRELTRLIENAHPYHRP
jgi:hypothetical protein